MPRSISFIAGLARTILLVVFFISATLQAQIVLRVGPHAMQDETGGPVIKLDLQFLTGPDGRIGLIEPSSPIRDKNAYDIRKADNAESPLKIKEVTQLPATGAARTIHLTLDKPLKRKTTYVVKLNGTWRIRNQEGSLAGVYVNPDKLPRFGEVELSAEESYAQNYGSKSHVEVTRADKGTALDVRLFAYGNERHVFGLNRMRWEAEIKGQVGLDTKQREIYSDNWVAHAFLGGRTQIGDLADPWRVPVYFGITTGLEGDRDFENIIGTTGVSLKLETAKLLSPIFKVFNDYNPLVVKRPDEPEVALLAPYWEFGYQYATKLRDDGSDEDFGENRIIAKFTWELPLMRHLGPEFFKVNADILLELHGIYHADVGEFTDESRVTLIVTRDVPDDNPLTLTVSYERGKATPKFQNYESLLVGFRKFF